ncbi:Pentatricopeptide repeat-containing protein [Spatholobus suberectus]|nr:Pentatricopeptide repeat-containing protein [Spatholobus suberectus]
MLEIYLLKNLKLLHHDVVSVFRDMLKRDTQGCYNGLVEEGYEYLHSMTYEYGIVPNIKHYGCMMDLLGRAGHLEEAYRFIDELPIKPTPILWRTLLSTCSSHGNVEMGKQVIQRIFELDDSNGGD